MQGMQQAFQTSNSLSSYTVICLIMFVVGVDHTVYLAVSQAAELYGQGR